jgi:phage I-like protein
MNYNNLIYKFNIIPEKTPPTEFALFTYGSNPAYHIGEGESDIFMSEQEAFQMMANNHAKRVMIDYDHGSLNPNPVDPAESAKAAGHGKLTLKENGIYLTEIEWTPKAARMIADGEFGGMSPAYEQDAEGNMKKLINVAITNLPALMNNAEFLNQKRSIEMAEQTQREKDLEAEVMAMKLSQKKMEAQFEAVAKAAELTEIKGVVGQAITLGQLGHAEEEEYVGHGVKYGKQWLVSMLSKLPRTLPTSGNRPQQMSIQHDVETQEDTSTVAGISDEKLRAIIDTLSAPGNDAPALIKTEEDKIKFLNKLKNPDKAIRSSRFFRGYGDRRLGPGSNVIKGGK